MYNGLGGLYAHYWLPTTACARVLARCAATALLLAHLYTVDKSPLWVFLNVCLFLCRHDPSFL